MKRPMKIPSDEGHAYYLRARYGDGVCRSCGKSNYDSPGWDKVCKACTEERDEKDSESETSRSR